MKSAVVAIVDAHVIIDDLPWCWLAEMTICHFVALLPSDKTMSCQVVTALILLVID